MIQRIIILCLTYILLITMPVVPDIIPCAIAQEAAKINSINFDNSDSIIFLGISANSETSTVNITKKTLTEPNRVYFDIENAVITFPNKSYELKNSRLKQVKIAQNSISPDVVRLVIWSSEGYDNSQIKVLTIKNNIIIKLGSEKPLQQYLTQVYKETKESAVEYYDKAVVIAEGGKNTEEANEIFNSVQKAFSIEGQELVRPNIEQKQARLKSRFFLERVSVRNGGLLLSGIGVVNLEKPFILSDPSRIVFDLPNTIVLQELREKEFKISEVAVAKIGQFEPSKARVVIKAPAPERYKPIYSTNLQTLLITSGNGTSGVSVTPVKTELSSFKERTINSNTNEINIIFTNPVIYSIQKDQNKLKVYFYNLFNFDVDAFNSASVKNKSGYYAQKTGINTFIISFPTDNNSLVDCYETLNASQLRFVLTKVKSNIAGKDTQNTIQKEKIKLPDEQRTEKEEKIEKQRKTIDLKLKPLFDGLNKKSAKISKKQKKADSELIDKIKYKTIILDPGHGGNDTGAMRNGILEKNLTLEIALKVRDYLREKGMTNIIMTRQSDKTLSLDERVQIANDNDASIFISIHINASVKSEIKGIETHYYTDRGYNLAKLMHKELINNIDAADRGLFKSKFYVINHTEAPAVLLELGFISNEQEREALTSEERQMSSAQAIADGIIKFLTEH